MAPCLVPTRDLDRGVADGGSGKVQPPDNWAESPA